MGSFANTLFKIMLGWLQGAVSAIWSAFTTENGASLLAWIGSHWLLIAGILCVVGLTADLCVYLLRWKPYKVWKSFFSQHADQEQMNEGGHRTETPERVFKTQTKEETGTAATGWGTGRQTEEAADLSQWEEEPEDDEKPISTPSPEPPVITNAGYIVPADSPYRRPTESKDVSHAVATSLETDQTPAREERDEQASVIPRRRRRISVADLFSNPEEDMQEFDAPQQVIDSHRAYHDPVYPRGWKKDEENGE